MDNRVDNSTLVNEADKRLQDFVEASSDWFWEMDEQCRFSYFSDRFTEITGVPQEALLGKTRQETGIPDVDPDAWEQHLADLAAHRSFRNFIHPRKLPNGEVIFLSINGKAIFDGAGNFLGYRGTGRDITAEQTAEKARVESTTLYKRTTRLARLGHWVWDEIEDRSIYCSEELARIHGVTPDEFIAMTQSSDDDLQRVHPGDREKFRLAVEHAIANKTGFQVEYRIVRPDGVIVHLRESSEPVINNKGELVHSFGFIQDITDLKKTERALDEKSIQLERATQIARLGFWSFDHVAEKYTSVSDQYAHIHGYEPDEFFVFIDGLDEDMALVHPDDRVRVEQAYKENDYLEIEYRIVRKDGVTRNVREIAEHVHDADGKLLVTHGIVQDITEIVEAREALKQSNAELEARVLERTAEIIELYESLRLKESHLLQSQRFSRMGGFVWDELNDRPEQISQEFADLFKMSVSQAYELFASRKHAENLILPEDRVTYREARESAKTNKKPYDVVYRSLDTNDRMHYWRETGEPVFDDDDNHVKTYGSLQNITKFKFTEAALKEREALLRQAHRISKIGFWTADEGEVLRISLELAALLGRSHEEFDGISNKQFIEQFIHEDDRQRVIEFFDSINNDERYEHEFRINTSDGEVIWVREAGEWLENEATGKKIEIGTIQDITAHKLIEQHLRTSERRFRSLIENLPSGIILQSENGEIILANSRLQHWCRVALADIVGKTMSDVFPSAVAQKIDTAHQTVIRFNAPRQFEFDWAIDDVVRHFSAIKFPIPLSREITAMGMIVSDVTEQRRTAAQLQRSQKMEAVGQLTGGVAHDFNNLLAVILGSAEMLDGHVDSEDKKGQKLLNSIIHSSTRGAELTQRLLSFSRQLPLHASEVDVVELLNGLKDMVSRSLGELYEVRFTIAPDTWLITVDAGQLENAILNLAINAGHAMPNGGLLHIESYNTTIDKRTAMERDEMEPGDYAVIVVSDTGTGMTPEVMTKAIEPFFTTKEVGEGSGLGLSMVYGFAKQSGGDLTIYSESGHGTSIRIYLPRTKSEEEQFGETAQDTKSVLGNETIFVIEDNEDVRNMLELMLEDLGYKVIIAEHAEAAYKVLESGEQFDLLLSDVVLPGGTDGPEFVAEIKDDYPDLKVLFMTGYAESTKYQHNGDQTDYDLISKPFHKQEIANRLRVIFDG